MKFADPCVSDIGNLFIVMELIVALGLKSLQYVCVATKLNLLPTVVINTVAIAHCNKFFSLQ